MVHVVQVLVDVVAFLISLAAQAKLLEDLGDVAAGHKLQRQSPPQQLGEPRIYPGSSDQAQLLRLSLHGLSPVEGTASKGHSCKNFSDGAPET